MSSPSTLIEPESDPVVLRIAEVDAQPLIQFFADKGLELVEIPAREKIPGSFWGEPEAGLIGSRLYCRADTPVHSVLHEGCHYLCMPPERRDGLHTNAGGTVQEENAVCYLQIVLSDQIGDIGSERLMRDMDAWGYSFQLGSARRWFQEDVDDTREWLQQRGIIP